jgi:hypothetical protein
MAWPPSVGPSIATEHAPCVEHVLIGYQGRKDAAAQAVSAQPEVMPGRCKMDIEACIRKLPLFM